MKFRISLGVLALIAGMVLGFGAIPAHAQTASPAIISDADRANLQSVLDLTETILDTIQLQINNNAVQNRTATLSALSGIRAYLLNIQGILGGGQVSLLIEEPEPTTGQTAQTPTTPAEPVAMSDEETAGEVSGASVVTAEDQNPLPSQTANVSSSVTSKRAFWIILIAAIVIAIILAIPRKDKSGVVMLKEEPGKNPQTPQPQPTPPQQAPGTAKPEEPETIQSA